MIGDAKKAKEQAELLAQDVAAFKELYQKNQAEVEKLDKIKAEIDAEKSSLAAEKAKVKEEKEAAEKFKSAGEQIKKAVELDMKKLEIEKAEFSASVEKEKQEVEAKAFKAAKQFQDAVELKKQADSLFAEYSEKLSKLKAMVG